MIKPKLYYKFSKRKRHTSKHLPLNFLNRPAIFETMRSYEGRILAESAHLQRLAESAHAAGFRLRWSKEAMVRWIKACLHHKLSKQNLIRLMAVWARDEQALILQVRPFGSLPARIYRDGVKVAIARTTRDQARAHNAQIKANQYLDAVTAFWQGAGEYHETFFVNSNGYLSEGSVSNLGIVKHGKVFTPDASCGILRGVTRQLVLKAATKLGIPYLEVPLTRHDLYNADEAFLTTTLREVVPVVRCNQMRIGKGKPGAITKAIHQSFKAVVRELSHAAH